jgi:predicted transcriptional regulator
MDTTVTFNLPSELDDSLKIIAKERMVSKSAMIRMILADHVANSSARFDNSAIETAQAEEDAA